jgi:ring-1,2-phenylacetyl-CoA epoxidase subunit PaaD
MSERSEQLIPTLNPVFAKRRAHRNASAYGEIWNVLDAVYDPELPGLTIWDLGVLQDIKPLANGWQIDVTPTYSGCPAIETINDDIVKAMHKAGYQDVTVKLVLAPAWSTEMMSPAGKAHLQTINIAPPDENDQIDCPVCNSEKVKVISQFGSTACKALYQCESCHENFDYFKHF